MRCGEARAALAIGRAVGLVAAVAAPAVAKPVFLLDLPAARLADTAIAIGGRAGVSVGVSDPGLAALPAPAVRGQLSVEAALARMIEGLPARIARIDRRTYAVLRAMPRREPRRAVTTGHGAAPRPADDIVVTASKRGSRVADFPGTIAVLAPTPGERAAGARGTDAIVARLPSLASTHLGPGRNKLFIRGVADSSFTGPTQATVGQYLGDIRLNYNAPDPDLLLYDIGSVEVLKGPQGTLYGAGSLGGIIRIIPAPVALDRAEGAVIAGAAAAAHGAGSSDVAAMLDLPIVPARIGARGVAYRVSDGGYIDDAGRGRRDTNRTRTSGGRLAVDARIGGDWAIEAGGTLQTIDSDDSQYAERGLPPLTRRTAIAQPFDNDYLLGDLIVTGMLGGGRLVSATGVVRHDVVASYDFTPAGGAPRRFRQHNAITLVSNETRLARTHANGTGWLIGASLIRDAERLTRTLGTLDDPARITGVHNDILDGALYGEFTAALAPRLQITAGARLALAHLSGGGIDEKREGGDESARTERRLQPLLALSWHPAARLTLFARYAEGFRAGGLSVAGEDGDNGARLVERFRGDTIGSYEAGARLGGPADRWSGAVSLSYAHWEAIQADLVDGAGLPYTANIGTGHILGFEASAGWRPSAALSVDASLFLNDSDLARPAAPFATSKGAALPNVANLGGRLGASYSRAITSGLGLTLAADARYFGRSRLGIGPSLDIPQGRYVDSGASVRIGTPRGGVTLGASNLLDTAGNRFSLGDPFDVAGRRQTTPLRPRTIRLGLDARF